MFFLFLFFFVLQSSHYYLCVFSGQNTVLGAGSSIPPYSTHLAFPSKASSVTVHLAANNLCYCTQICESFGWILLFTWLVLAMYWPILVCSGFLIDSPQLVAQLWLTLCNPMQVSLSMGLFQARILEWVAISFSRDLPDPGIKPGFPALQAEALSSESPGKPELN